MTALPENDAPIIEVPPELRGPSDAEILAMNPVNEDKRFRPRPSKKERDARKIAKEQEKFRKIAAQYDNRENLPSNPFSSASLRPMPKLSDFDPSKEKRSSAPVRTQVKNGKGSLFVPGEFKKTTQLPSELPVVAKKTTVVLPSRPASGRVLSGSFGTSKSVTPKARIISVNSDEVKEKKKFSLAAAAEEAARALAISKAAMLSQTDKPQNPFASTPLSAKPSIFRSDSPLAEPSSMVQNSSAEIAPVKRKRGRPRKNPLPDSL